MPQIRFFDSPASRSQHKNETDAQYNLRSSAIMALEREFRELLTLGVRDQSAGFMARRVCLAQRLLELTSVPDNED
jgi:hypothetical protein